ncbi:MAG: S9 family peptidase [Flavobacteriaceae bacterium]
MKFNSLIFLILGTMLSLQAQKRIQQEDIWQWRYSPERLESIRSMQGGEYYTVLKNTKIIQYAYADADFEQLILDADEKPELPRFRGYTFSKDESKILLETNTQPIYRRSKKAIYWIYDRNTQQVQMLFDAPVQEPQFSPDGQKVAFSYQRNLYVKDLSANTIQQITDDGSQHIINGTTDWVYEEEFGFVRAFVWDASSSQLLFMRFDETNVPEFSMDIYGSQLYPFPYTFKYPKAGEKNAVVSLHSYDLATTKVQSVSMASDDWEYVPRILATPQDHIVTYQTMNRHQNKLQLWSLNLKTNASKLLLEETDKAYVDIADDLRFLKNGDFIWSSDRSGFKHLYRYNAEGKLLNQITKGEWEITAFYGVDAQQKEVYYQSTEKTTIGRGVYAVRINGRGKRALTAETGSNGAFFSRGGQYFIHTYSDEQTPPKYSLRSTSSGKVVRELLNNEELSSTLSVFKLPQKEFSTIQVNGNSLNMYMIKPRDFDPNKQYPMLMFQYSGPGSQQVANRWGSQRDLWHKYLTDKGYIIACVDGRGTGFKGADFKKVTYLNLVKYEAEDQIAAAQQLGERSYIDADRIGIWGWSFGGHMALQCLLTGADVFAAAVSVAPVTNWRFYDTIYTERFMRTPTENASGYDDNSPINYADQLKGKLLLIHGSGDDNVHVQNSMRMAEALIQADKDFEFMIYPDKNHGIYGGNTRIHLYRKMTNFILNNL